MLCLLQLCCKLHHFCSHRTDSHTSTMTTQEILEGIIGESSVHDEAAAGGGCEIDGALSEGSARHCCPAGSQWEGTGMRAPCRAVPC